MSEGAFLRLEPALNAENVTFRSHKMSFRSDCGISRASILRRLLRGDNTGGFKLGAVMIAGCGRLWQEVFGGVLVAPSCIRDRKTGASACETARCDVDASVLWCAIVVSSEVRETRFGSDKTRGNDDLSPDLASISVPPPFSISSSSLVSAQSDSDSQARLS